MTIRDAKELAKHIKNIRLQQELTQKELVERLENKIPNISQVLISKIENGVRRLSATEVVDYAEALGVTVEQLLTKKGECKCLESSSMREF